MILPLLTVCCWNEIFNIFSSLPKLQKATKNIHCIIWESTHKAIPTLDFFAFFKTHFAESSSYISNFRVALEFSSFLDLEKLLCTSDFYSSCVWFSESLEENENRSLFNPILVSTSITQWLLHLYCESLGVFWYIIVFSRKTRFCRYAMSIRNHIFN